MNGYFYELETAIALEDERRVRWSGKSGHIDLMLLDPVNGILVFRARDDESGENFYGWKTIGDSDVQGIMMGDQNPMFIFPS